MLPDTPPWIAPVAYWSLIQSITGLTVTFTSQQSLLRPITTAIISFLAHLFRLHIQSHLEEIRLWAPVFAMCMVNVLNAFDLLLFTRASYAAQLAYTTTKSEKKDIPTQHASLSNKLLFSLLLPYNYRRINTPWQISRLPRFSSTDPSYVPTRPAFLLRSALKLAIASAVVRLLTIDPEDPHLLEALAHLEQSKSVLLPFRNYSAYTILLQARFTLSFGIVTRAFIVGSYTANSILAVALGSDPASWPPIAGSLTEAWSLKTLWGCVVRLSFFLSFPFLQTNPTQPDQPNPYNRTQTNKLCQTNLAPNPPPPPLLHLPRNHQKLRPPPNKPRRTLDPRRHRVPRLRCNPLIHGHRLRRAAIGIRRVGVFPAADCRSCF
ncbi:hypothetical protein BDW62DRAFT_190157 [Aspergillus aurantiobrunneus]